MLRSWLHDNPALQREWQLLRCGSWVERGPWGWLGLVACGALYGGAAWWFSLPEVTPWSARSALLTACLAYLLLVGLILPGYAVNLLARERQQERWQELLLTTLTPSQLAAAKLVGSSYPAFVLLGAWLPVLLMGAHAGQLPPDHVFALLAVLAASGPAVAALGLWVALRVRNSRNALLPAYLLANGLLWVTLAWNSPLYVRGENLWWYLSPAWHAGVLCVASVNASPLALPLLPEWFWSVLLNGGLTALFFGMVVQRIGAVAGEP